MSNGSSLCRAEGYPEARPRGGNRRRCAVFPVQSRGDLHAALWARGENAVPPSRRRCRRSACPSQTWSLVLFAFCLSSTWGGGSWSLTRRPPRLPPRPCIQPAHQPFIRPICKHELQLSCKDYHAYTEDPTRLPPCAVEVTHLPPCGHEAQRPCWQATQPFGQGMGRPHRRNEQEPAALRSIGGTSRTPRTTFDNLWHFGLSRG